MFPEDTDYYAILGLDRRCTLAQIRTAYRLLSKRHHPDVNGGSAEAVEHAKLLNAAHETLSDATRRRAYDRELSERESKESKATPKASTSVSKAERNITHDVNLRIEDFIRGTTLNVRVNDPANPDGPETYSLTVPEDTAPGTRFRIPRDGTFRGGFVVVRVTALPGFRFKARGSDLRCDLRIDARRATQGGTEVMPGPTGAPVRVIIPPRVARSAIIKVPGEGLPKPRGGRGDLLVRITYRPEVQVTRAGRR